MREPENENDEWERLRWRDHTFRRQEAQGQRDPERGARGSGVAKPRHTRACARAFACRSLVFRTLTFRTLRSTIYVPYLCPTNHSTLATPRTGQGDCAIICVVVEGSTY